MAKVRLAFLKKWKFLKCHSGVAAVEFALISPIFLLLLLGTIQFGLIFFVQMNMLNAAQLGARGLSIGTIDVAQAKTYIAEQGVGKASDYTVKVSDTGAEYVVTVQIPTSKVIVVDFFGTFGGQGKTLTAKAAARKQTPTTSNTPLTP